MLAQLPIKQNIRSQRGLDVPPEHLEKPEAHPSLDSNDAIDLQWQSLTTRVFPTIDGVAY